MLQIALSLISVRKRLSDFEFLVQKRTNEGMLEWRHTWEFPQGKMDNWDPLNFAKYKYNNETGMTLQKIMISKKNWVDVEKTKSINWCEPLIVAYEGNDLSIHLFVQGTGEPINTEQAIDHRWANISVMEELLEAGLVCPLNRAAFTKLIELYKSGEIAQFM